ncbi:hypothetical protein JYP49_06410 [Nitratireductor aquimarinus]|uniref:hypothetical protein n=1 Tax=Nitratireductor TaxID=245876 RepID=UPI0019D3BE58|nr:MULTISPECIES: hypothetical protein [Nitratireductor]MBN7776880.1 hypothetical protein [Nitratireductor pacificus]MBN7780214.1 hypothetical protein [Nitratireductor pacificus]MBN7789021.1 hypothetical protein [Nitratireductor aquimarinus]MBY6099089.1 hypothetical protein [Nitratireductor aquimarinus]MCA1261371.1 hypothetical protein [Nitratireductor aquimarinus]
MTENPNFIPQEDGTYLPSADLVRRVRENPEQFPHAVDDFAVMSGKTREEVEAILKNPVRDGGTLDILPSFSGPKLFMDAAEGVTRGVGWAARHLIGDEAGQAVDGVADAIDPAFETERGLVENLQETAGQAIPGVAAGLGAAAVAPVSAPVAAGIGAVATAGVTTLTFADDDNPANFLEEISGGAVPDAFVVQEDDDAQTAALKSFAANLSFDLATIGAGKLVAKVYRLFKGGKPTAKALAEVAEEAGLTLREDADTLAREAMESGSPEISPAKAEAAKVTTRELRRVSDDAAKARIDQEVAGALEGRSVTGELPRVRPANPEASEAFMLDVTRKVELFERRTAQTTDFPPIRQALKQDFDRHGREVFELIDEGRIAEATKAIKKGARWSAQGLATNEVNSIGVYNTILTKSALDRVDADFKSIVLRLRENPDGATRVAIDKVARERIESLTDLWDHYRNLGTSASHQLLARKGLGNGGDLFGDIASDLTTAADEVSEELGKRGIALFDSEAEFVSKRILAFDEAGITPGEFLARLYDEFAEYEAMVAGVKENVRQRARLTPLDELGLVAKGVQFLKDLQSAMLLGQFMTAGTEVVSTGFNALLLPALKVAGGGSAKRWAKEMSGLWHSTALARANAWASFKKGKDVSDDFFMKEGAFSRALDHENMSLPSSLVWRVFSIAVDTAQASASFFKTSRAYGLAYADGLEAALAGGMKKADAIEAARKYAAQRFDANGAIIDEDLRLRAGQAAFQQAFDGSTLTGKLGQKVENLRNSEAALGTVGLAARGALPFFRTLTNIGHNSAQMILPPGFSAGIKRIFPKGTGTAKFLDDFTGKNGAEAMQSARGRNRVGMALVATGYGFTQFDGIEITGPSRGQRWDAKKRSFEEYPASSLIIGDTAVDLTRFLPFSAPLLLAGTMRDYELEDQLRMEGGEYDPSEGTLHGVTTYLTATAVTLGTLLQDAGAARGVFDFFDAVNQAVSEQDLAPLTRYGQNWAVQFTPGPVKMAGRAGGNVQHEGYDFWQRWVASTGFSTGWERLDFFGHPIRYPTGKGLDPSNRRVLNLDDPAYAEFAQLNKFEGLSLVLPRPDRVIRKQDWASIGVSTDGILGAELPSLSEMRVRGGGNAWETFRKLIYTGKATGEIRKTIPLSNGVKVTIKEGENFEAAIRRIIDTEGYQNSTLEFRKNVWTTVFGVFQSEAREFLKGNLVVPDSVFKGSKYGVPQLEGDGEPVYDVVRRERLERASEIGRSRGNPLDEIFGFSKGRGGSVGGGETSRLDAVFGGES